MSKYKAGDIVVVRSDIPAIPSTLAGRLIELTGVHAGLSAALDSDDSVYTVKDWDLFISDSFIQCKANKFDKGAAVTVTHWDRTTHAAMVTGFEIDAITQRKLWYTVAYADGFVCSQAGDALTARSVEAVPPSYAIGSDVAYDGEKHQVMAHVPERGGYTLRNAGTLEIVRGVAPFYLAPWKEKRATPLLDALAAAIQRNYEEQRTFGVETMSLSAARLIARSTLAHLAASYHAELDA